jgi:ABC-type Fe3+/spermidine/putrescine transport system ATPase subunit
MSEVQFDRVDKSFGETRALDSVRLVVPDGSRTAVIGGSGSGKSTLLRLISGFERPDSGVISLGGEVVASTKVFVPAHRRNVGLVAQDGSLFRSSRFSTWSRSIGDSRHDGRTSSPAVNSRESPLRGRSHGDRG